MTTHSKAPGGEGLPVVGYAIRESDQFVWAKSEPPFAKKWRAVVYKDDASTRAATLRAEVERLTIEVNEQARCNGMGAERELSLLAQVERLTSERDKWYQEASAQAASAIRANEEHDALHAENDRMQASFVDLNLDVARLSRELAEVKAFLQDPVLVHIGMLREEVAKPAIRDMLHLYGEKAVEQFDRGADLKREAALQALSDSGQEIEAMGRVDSIMALADAMSRADVCCVLTAETKAYHENNRIRDAARTALRAALEAKP